MIFGKGKAGNLHFMPSWPRDPEQEHALWHGRAVEGLVAGCHSFFFFKSDEKLCFAVAGSHPARSHKGVSTTHLGVCFRCGFDFKPPSERVKLYFQFVLPGGQERGGCFRCTQTWDSPGKGSSKTRDFHVLQEENCPQPVLWEECGIPAFLQ